MKFNHELQGLDNGDRLLLEGVETTVQELRYGLDQVFLNEISVVLLQSLKTYGVSLTADYAGDWLRQGLESSRFNFETQTEQTGRLRLKIGLEFCPDRLAETHEPGELLNAEPSELAIEAVPYSSTSLPIPSITLIRSGNDS